MRQTSVARPETQQDAPRGGGQDQRPDAQALQDADGERDRVEVVALVVVDPPLQDQHASPGQRPGDELVAVTRDRCPEKVRDLPVRDRYRVGQAVGQRAQARAEDDRDPGRLRHGRDDRGGGLAGAFEQVEVAHSRRSAIKSGTSTGPSPIM